MLSRPHPSHLSCQGKTRKRGMLIVPSVAETKANQGQCCKLSTSLLPCPSGLCAMHFYQSGGHWLCNRAKFPCLERKESAVDMHSASRISKAASFFPMSCSGGLGKAATREGQVESNGHRLCQISCLYNNYKHNIIYYLYNNSY